MKKFDVPQMALVHLAGEDIIYTSLCPANYCDGFTCDQCEDHEHCVIQGPCKAFNCGHYLCPEYVG